MLFLSFDNEFFGIIYSLFGSMQNIFLIIYIKFSVTFDADFGLLG